MEKSIDKMRICLWLSELNRKGGIQSATIKSLLKEYGSISQLAAAKPKCLVEKTAGPPEKVNQLRAFLGSKNIAAQIEDQAEKAVQKKIRPVSILDDDYPRLLRNIGSSPIVLYCRGDRYSEILRSPYFVTMIGTRTPTPYGRMVTRQISSELSRQGVVIISGLARGIDSLAHQAALETDGLTIAVVGSGPDIAYPPENEGLMNQIAEKGLIISEHPPGTMPLKNYFPARNRILSGLADAVAVIEASTRSGTMITASFAGDQGKDVFAVPGNIVSPYSSGCNQLIREGAEVLTCARDILWRLPKGQFQTWLEQVIHQPDDDLSNGQLPDTPGFRQEIIHALTGHPMTMAEIKKELDLSLHETAIALTELEIKGLVHIERGRYSLTRMALCSI